MRTRQKHAARIFNNAFSVDSFFYNHTEGVALCSDTHTSNSHDGRHLVGFDNKITDRPVGHGAGRRAHPVPRLPR
jgi:hypothetical protein